MGISDAFPGPWRGKSGPGGALLLGAHRLRDRDLRRAAGGWELGAGRGTAGC